MSPVKLQFKPILQVFVSLLLSSLGVAQTIPATGLCNTGLTPASPVTGCTTSTLVSPVNPISGGPSVDGNWQLASPYPSAPFNGQAPDACALTTFGPAWVDTPSGSWYNPNDALSQWISPEVEEQAAGGWYVYRTTLQIPAPASRSGEFLLIIKGNVLGDDIVSGIILAKAKATVSSCTGPTALPSPTPVPTDGLRGGWYSWIPFELVSTVTANTSVNLYVMVFNTQSPSGQTGNYTGLRIEFTSATLTPE
jgi:hypothetical protein